MIMITIIVFIVSIRLYNFIGWKITINHTLPYHSGQIKNREGRRDYQISVLLVSVLV